jgi:PKD repeat protein
MSEESGGGFLFRDDFELNDTASYQESIRNIEFSADVVNAGKNEYVVPMYEMKLTVEPVNKTKGELSLNPNGIVIRPPYAMKGGMFSFTVTPQANIPLIVAFTFRRVNAEPTAWEYLKYRFRKWLGEIK